MRHLGCLLAFAALGVFGIGCEELDEVFSDSVADFSFVSTKQTYVSWGAPAIEVTVKNTGERTAYNVACDINALRGSTIIHSTTAYFAGLNDIDPGQQAMDEAIFWTMDSHADYSRLEYTLRWIERETFRKGERTKAEVFPS